MMNYLMTLEMLETKIPNADARPNYSDWISRNIQNYDIDADLVSKIMIIINLKERLQQKVQ